MTEMWLVHCLEAGSGRVLVGAADSRKNANKLYKEMCIDLCGDENGSPDDFVHTIKKVAKLNEVVLDLT